MRAEKRRGYVDRVGRGERPDGAEHLDFILRRKPVAALDLARGGAAREHLVEPAACGGHERILRGGPCRSHGRDDAAAGGGDLRIRGTGQPAGELAAAIAGECGMRVGVHEARQDGVLALKVDCHGAGQKRQAIEQRPGGACVDEPSAARGERAIRDGAGIALCRAAPGRRAGAGEELAGVQEDEVRFEAHGSGEHGWSSRSRRGSRDVGEEAAFELRSRQPLDPQALVPALVARHE